MTEEKTALKKERFPRGLFSPGILNDEDQKRLAEIINEALEPAGGPNSGPLYGIINDTN